MKPRKRMILNKQFLVYIAGGFFCAALDIGIMQLLIWFGVNYMLATSVGFFLSFLVNYAYHAKLTFQSTSAASSFVKFSFVVALNYLITLGFVYVAYTCFGAVLMGKILSLPIIAVNGFLLGKFWIFK